MLIEETRKDLEKQIEEIKEQQPIEEKKLEELYRSFLQNTYNQYSDENKELEYYQLVYGKHIVVEFGTGYQQDTKQLLHYRKTKGKLPKRLEMKFNEWLLTNKV